MFEGGPLDGQMGADPNAAPPEAPAEGEGELLKRILADVRALLQAESLTEQNKLAVSKAETLFQQVLASEEKEQDAAMGGKLSPGILRKLGGGGA